MRGATARSRLLDGRSRRGLGCLETGLELIQLIAAPLALVSSVDELVGALGVVIVDLGRNGHSVRTHESLTQRWQARSRGRNGHCPVVLIGCIIHGVIVQWGVTQIFLGPRNQLRGPVQPATGHGVRGRWGVLHLLQLRL